MWHLTNCYKNDAKVLVNFFDMSIFWYGQFWPSTKQPQKFSVDGWGTKSVPLFWWCLAGKKKLILKNMSVFGGTIVNVKKVKKPLKQLNREKVTLQCHRCMGPGSHVSDQEHLQTRLIPKRSKQTSIKITNKTLFILTFFHSYYFSLSRNTLLITSTVFFWIYRAFFFPI